VAGILILAEHFQGALREITAEVVGAALSLKDNLGGPIILAVLSEGNADLAASANVAGVDEILSVNVGTAHFDAALYEEAAFRLGERLRPRVVLLGPQAPWLMRQLWPRALAAALRATYLGSISLVTS
jgi:electron transfer flavoprotein alpha subunit